MKYVLLDCDYTERENYRLNNEISFEDIKKNEYTDLFVSNMFNALNKLEGYDYECELIFEPFVSKNDALNLLDDYKTMKDVNVLEDLVYASCLVEGDPSVVNRGLDCVSENIISLEKLYNVLERSEYKLPLVTTNDIKNDILTYSMLKRQNIITKENTKVK